MFLLTNWAFNAQQKRPSPVRVSLFCLRRDPGNANGLRLVDAQES
jgi:hypothetical protein